MKVLSKRRLMRQAGFPRKSMDIDLHTDPQFDIHLTFKVTFNLTFTLNLSMTLRRYLVFYTDLRIAFK